MKGMTLAQAQAHNSKVAQWRSGAEPKKPGRKPRIDKGGPFAYEPAKVVAGVLSVALPLKLVNGANVREHWAERKKRAKAHRDMVAQAIPRKDRPRLPVTVTITRVGIKPMDSDGLAISCKHVRDGIADVYGIDDGASWYAWEYKQDLGEDYGVRVEIRSR